MSRTRLRRRFWRVCRAIDGRQPSGEGNQPGERRKGILLRSDIFVEFPPQTRIEGEIQQLAPDHPVTELWRVMTGQDVGRKSDKQITLFDSVGFAIEDFSALRYVRDRVEGSSHSSPLDLLADPDEPRDLFGMLLRRQAFRRLGG